MEHKYTFKLTWQLSRHVITIAVFSILQFFLLLQSNRIIKHKLNFPFNVKVFKAIMHCQMEIIALQVFK